MSVEISHQRYKAEPSSGAGPFCISYQMWRWRALHRAASLWLAWPGQGTQPASSPAELLLGSAWPPWGLSGKLELYRALTRHTRASPIQASPRWHGTQMMQKWTVGTLLHRRLGLCAHFCPKKICDYFISRFALEHALYYDSAQYCDPQLVSGNNNILRQWMSRGCFLKSWRLWQEAWSQCCSQLFGNLQANGSRPRPHHRRAPAPHLPSRRPAKGSTLPSALSRQPLALPGQYF